MKERFEARQRRQQELGSALGLLEGARRAAEQAPPPPAQGESAEAAAARSMVLLWPDEPARRQPMVPASIAQVRVHRMDAMP